MLIDRVVFFGLGLGIGRRGFGGRRGSGGDRPGRTGIAAARAAMDGIKGFAEFFDLHFGSGLFALSLIKDLLDLVKFFENAGEFGTDVFDVANGITDSAGCSAGGLGALASIIGARATIIAPITTALATVTAIWSSISTTTTTPATITRFETSPAPASMAAASTAVSWRGGRFGTG
jgi:hypothetical protein